MTRTVSLMCHMYLNKSAIVNSNFAPVPPSDELDETTSCSILTNLPHYVKTCRHPQNRKHMTHRTVVRGGLNNGHR